MFKQIKKTFINDELERDEEITRALLRGLRSQKLNGRWTVELAAISGDGTRRSLGEK